RSRRRVMRDASDQVPYSDASRSLLAPVVRSSGGGGGSAGRGGADAGALRHLAAFLAEHRIADHGHVGAEGPVALHLEARSVLERGHAVGEARLEVLDELVGPG